jgi:hypothetical protein
MSTEYPKDRQELVSDLQGYCTARSKTTGQTCRRYAILGGNVCYYHGGNAPQVIKAAKERIREMLLPSLDRLETLVDQREFPSTAMSAVRLVVELNDMLPELKTRHSGRVTVSDDLPTELPALVAFIESVMGGGQKVIEGETVPTPSPFASDSDEAKAKDPQILSE